MSQVDEKEEDEEEDGEEANFGQVLSASQSKK